MAVAYTTAVKNSRLAAVVTAIGATGVLEIGTAGMAVILATINLNSTAGVAASGVLTFSGFPKSDTAADNTGGAAAVTGSFSAIESSPDVYYASGLVLISGSLSSFDPVDSASGSGDVIIRGVTGIS